VQIVDVKENIVPEVASNQFGAVATSAPSAAYT